MIKIAGVICFIILFGMMVISFLRAETGNKQVSVKKAQKHNNNHYIDKKLNSKKDNDPYVEYLITRKTERNGA
jgi:hypothetical protein